MASPLGQGRIFWVIVPDPRGGNAKRRPAVVLTPTAEIDAAGAVEVAAVTTQLGQARFSESVELPSLPTGHPDTKLKKPCEVVCSWVLSVPVSDLSDGGGFVPADVLAEILVKVSRLSGPVRLGLRRLWRGCGSGWRGGAGARGAFSPPRRRDCGRPGPRHTDGTDRLKLHGTAR